MVSKSCMVFKSYQEVYEQVMGKPLFEPTADELADFVKRLFAMFRRNWQYMPGFKPLHELELVSADAPFCLPKHFDPRTKFIWLFGPITLVDDGQRWISAIILMTRKGQMYSAIVRQKNTGGSWPIENVQIVKFTPGQLRHYLTLEPGRSKGLTLQLQQIFRLVHAQAALIPSIQRQLENPKSSLSRLQQVLFSA
jgi:hypothetical protein